MARKKTKIDIMETAGLVAGGFAGSQVTKQAPKLLFKETSTVDAETQMLIASAFPLVIGIAGKMFLGSKVKGVFDGMIAAGGAGTLNSFVNGSFVNGLRSNEVPGVNVRNAPTGTSDITADFGMFPTA